MEIQNADKVYMVIYINPGYGILRAWVRGLASMGMIGSGGRGGMEGRLEGWVISIGSVDEEKNEWVKKKPPRNARMRLKKEKNARKAQR